MSDKWRNPEVGCATNLKNTEEKQCEISTDVYELINSMNPFISSPRDLIKMSKGEIKDAINVASNVMRIANVMSVKCAVIMKDMDDGVFEDDGITYKKEENGDCSACQHIGPFGMLKPITDYKQMDLILGLVQDAFSRKGYHIPTYPTSPKEEDAYGVFEISSTRDGGIVFLIRIYIMLKNKE